MPLVREVGARPRCDDVRVRERRRDVDTRDTRVRVRAAHDRQVDHPRRAHVVDPLGLADEELLILFALDGGADRLADLELDRGGHHATASIARTMF